MHPILEEARATIRDGTPEDAVDSLLAFISSQLGGDDPRTRRFSDYRDEALFHAAGLRRTETRRRQGIVDPDRLDREERRLTEALLSLISEIDRRLSRSDSPQPAIPPRIAPDLRDIGIPERVYGRGNLQSLAWLDKGLRAGRSVCRVVTGKHIGTGFLVKGGRVVTNNHVVHDAETASTTRVEFNFERDAEGNLQQSVVYEVDPDGFFTIPQPMDCTVMRVRPKVGAPELDNWGALTLDGSSAPQVGEPVSIIQHPNGGEKQIAVTANEIVAIHGPRIAYLTDTLGGSSGAPVFDEHWHVVGLHRAGGAKFDTRDRGRVRANEGVLFSHLLKDDGLRAALGLSS